MGQYLHGLDLIFNTLFVCKNPAQEYLDYFFSSLISSDY